MWSWSEAKDYAERYNNVFEITTVEEIVEDLRREPYFVNKIRQLDNEDGDERYQAERDLQDELEDTAILVQETYKCNLNAGYTPNFEIHRCLEKYHDRCERLNIEPNDFMFVNEFERYKNDDERRRLEYL